jgi:hypothetical protein
MTASVAKYLKHLPRSLRDDLTPSLWDRSLITGQVMDIIMNFQKPAQKSVGQKITQIGLDVKYIFLLSHPIILLNVENCIVFPCHLKAHKIK